MRRSAFPATRRRRSPPTQVSAKQFREYLKSLGVVYKRTANGHEHYDRPDNSLRRPVTIVCDEDFVPLTHVKTNLRTLGKTLTDFRRWLSEH